MNKNTLNKIGNKLPFTVPENYFEQFASNLENQVMVKPVSVKRMIQPWLYAAAVFVGILLMSKIAFTVFQDKPINEDEYDMYVMSQINDADIYHYYVSNENNN